MPKRKDTILKQEGFYNMFLLNGYRYSLFYNIVTIKTILY